MNSLNIIYESVLIPKGLFNSSYEIIRRKLLVTCLIREYFLVSSLIRANAFYDSLILRLFQMVLRFFCADDFKQGHAWLSHHLGTVAGSLCTALANHLLVITLSSNTVLIRFKFAIPELFVMLDAKLLLLAENKELIQINRSNRV